MRRWGDREMGRPSSIKKRRKVRKEDLLGKGKNWESLKRELCIE
jgi:hypothetical protein